MCGSAAADPTLELRPVGNSGTIEVRFSDLPSNGVAGYQVFLEFDPSRMAFASGAYTSPDFGLLFVTPIAAAGDRITLAAGINAVVGQVPASADQTVATLYFTAVGTGCEPRVRVRSDATPPTRLTDADGSSIPGLIVVNAWPTCGADFNRDGNLGVLDIFEFLNAWFAQSCRADFDGVAGLSVPDIFDFLNLWFTGC